MSMILPPILRSQLFLWGDGKYRFIAEPVSPTPSGSTLVINGSGFGTGPTYVLFDRTEGVDGEDVPLNSPEIGTYASTNPNMAEPSNLPRYKTHLGRTWLTERRAPAVEDGLAHQAGFKFEFNSTDEFRVSYRLSVPQGKRWCGSGIDQPPNPNLSHHKPIWLGTDSAVNDGIGAADDAPDIVIATFSGSGGQRLTGGNSINCANRWYNGFHTDSMTVGTQTWQTWYQKYDSGTPANSINHEMIVCDTAFQQAEETGDVFAGVAGLIQHFYDVALIPGWFGNAGSGSEAPFNYTNVDHLMTDISISVGPNAGKMLLLGDAPVLSDCNRVYEVPADLWQDGRIEANPRDWEQLPYYFVVNKATVLQSGPAIYEGSSTEDWVAGQAPTLTSLTGTWAEGAVMTLNGENFSTEATQTYYSDFGEVADGQRAPDWYYWGTVTGADYLATSASNQPIGSKALVAEPTQQSFTTMHYQFPDGNKEVYVESWTKYEIIDGSDPEGGQIKGWWLVGGEGEDSMQSHPTALNFTRQTDNNWFYAVCGNHPSGRSNLTARAAGGAEVSTNDLEGDWHRVEYYYRFSDLDVANGATYAKWGPVEFFGSSNGSLSLAMGDQQVDYSAPNYDMASIITQATGVNEGQYPRRVAPLYYQRQNQTSRVSLAHVFISNSRERLIVGDAATWDACDRTKCYIVPAIARSRKQIEFVAKNSATIPATKWLYVVNHDGMVNTNGVIV